ncbi:phage tail protein [Pseudoponticoccus marisrubri]|uniref:Phage tail collar domain-containing protein n=1 Tax=Pseudoponticoccus marisrubri TaxID=1685382 RepID=A0A0W7WFT3_9RHOB|nr:tail fiber protein [Pseudoponticoccus marisrubri]KUF09433.1 hypothetical protein AVJ23_17480 [Pseudoponticoccus marisrubri]
MFETQTPILRAAAALVLVTAPLQASAGPQAFLGEIIPTAGSYCPRGTAEANGQLLSIADHSTLYSLLGTTYGGDGQTTFALPDLRGRVAVGEGTGPGLSTVRQGQAYGAETHALSYNEMPEHTHGANSTATSKLMASSETADLRDPNGAVLAQFPEAQGYSKGGRLDTAMAQGTVETRVETEVTAAGAGAPFPLAQPTLVLRYCVAITGVYPSRN